jgi:hypothetical protein
MYPFSIALRAGASSKTYTLCVASQAAREQWKEKIENAKALRRYDIESNRTFAIHTIYLPPEINLPGLRAADTFSWLGRETVVVGAGRSIWFGWRRDSQSEPLASDSVAQKLTRSVSRDRSFLCPADRHDCDSRARFWVAAGCRPRRLGRFQLAGDRSNT